MTVHLDLLVEAGRMRLQMRHDITAAITAVVGHPCAGKSLLFDAIAGIVRPARGHLQMGDTIVFDSEHHIDLPGEQRPVGYVPQRDVARPSNGTVEEYLGDVASHRLGTGTSLSLDRILKFLELDRLRRQPLRMLSKGNWRRVLLAAAVARGASLVLFDEPLISLELPRTSFLPSLRRVVDDFGLTVMYISHNRAEVEGVAESMLMLKEGSLVMAGPPDPSAWTATTASG